MDVKETILRMIAESRARRIAGSESARAIFLSLPVPAGAKLPAVGFSGRETQCRPLGKWPCAQPFGGGPRRLLLTGCVENAPDSLGLVRTEGNDPPGVFHGPVARVRVLGENHDRWAPYEINELVLSGPCGELGLRVGLDTGEGTHWWQWLRLETLDEGPVCRTIRARGAIPVRFDKAEDAAACEMPFGHPSTHRHNHVRGEIFARCFANGVIDLRVRHINGTFFSEGGDLCGVVPVIGFRAEGLVSESSREVTGPERWDGKGVSIDTGPAATLLGPNRPGKVRGEGDCLIYQPYAAVEPKAGKPAEIMHGDSHLAGAGDRRMPRGVARTVRLCCSLGEAPPGLATYLMPDKWYGLCRELFLEPLEPARSRFYKSVETAIDYFFRRTHVNCFDDGAVGRSDRLPDEPGWEGEVALGQMLGAYHTGEPRLYDLAIRSAYHLTDVATDHVLRAVRMHGYAPPAQSLSMQRVGGMIAGYLETGDPWFLETAEAVADNAWHWDTAAWPRRSVGRDAAYIRSLTGLYRCTGHEIYRDRARKALHRVAATQLPDGAYRQQGGTVGVHGHVNLTIKPWMGCAATEAIIDYLFIESDEILERAALRFADWLVGHKVTIHGETYWPYHYRHGDEGMAPEVNRTLPTARPWHEEYLALILGWATRHTGRPGYYLSWLESWEKFGSNSVNWDHGTSKVIQHLAWLSASGIAAEDTTPRTSK